MQTKKAQTAVEVMIIIGFIIFFFILFIAGIQSNTADKIYEKKDIAIKDIIKNVKEEIILASESQDGYKRNIEVPQTVIREDYEIGIFDNNTIYANTTNQRHAISLSIPNVIGQIHKGTNTIKKQNGKIYIN